MLKRLCYTLLFLTLLIHQAAYADNAKQTLRILTWDGYITEDELKEVNQLLEDLNYNYEAKIIRPYSEGIEQMFEKIRAGEVDVAFLTLFFIKMDLEQIGKLLQPINIKSPRLSNYQYLLPNLTQLPMGLNQDQQPLYIPWGGGTYGFYVNRDRVKTSDIPQSVRELWHHKWKGRYSLNKSQEWYNLGLSLMSLNKSPFHYYDLVQQGQLEKMNKDRELIERKLTLLYANAGDFWRVSPKFDQQLDIVSSWGPEIARENAKGSNWQMIHFEEGQMAWLDTINFTKEVSGTKLEAAEVFANFFISKKVQNRVAQDLSMVAASSQADINPLLGSPDKIFQANMFVPPYDQITYDIMERITRKANLEALNY